MLLKYYTVFLLPCILLNVSTVLNCQSEIAHVDLSIQVYRSEGNDRGQREGVPGHGYRSVIPTRHYNGLAGYPALPSNHLPGILL